MYKDKHTLAETLRKYRRHILGPLFVEAADTIEELLKCCDALERDNDQLTARLEECLTRNDDNEPCEACKIGGDD